MHKIPHFKNVCTPSEPFGIFLFTSLFFSSVSSCVTLFHSFSSDRVQRISGQSIWRPSNRPAASTASSPIPTHLLTAGTGSHASLFLTCLLPPPSPHVVWPSFQNKKFYHPPEIRGSSS